MKQIRKLKTNRCGKEGCKRWWEEGKREELLEERNRERKTTRNKRWRDCVRETARWRDREIERERETERQRRTERKKTESEGVREEVKEGDRSARERVCERTQSERELE